MRVTESIEPHAARSGAKRSSPPILGALWLIAAGAFCAACAGGLAAAGGGGGGGETGRAAGGSGGNTGGGGAGGNVGSSGGATAAGGNGGAAAGGSSGGGSGGEAPHDCVAEIAVGEQHTCALRSDGAVWCWGANDHGQLGDGTTQGPNTSPTQVVALGSGVAGITAGSWHTCARKTDGSLRCWGRNDQGQLGDGSTQDATTPVPVALGAGVAAVAAGHAHTCASMLDGLVWCWGNNAFGQTGDGASGPPKLTPALVAGITGTVAINAGVEGLHTCARKSNGTLWCWGYDGYGQLGDGTADPAPKAPVQVASMGTSVDLVAPGGYHTCARKTDGSLWCWGDNGVGQLGNGTSGQSSNPVAIEVSALGTSVATVAAGQQHGCAVKTDGTLWCWGANDTGVLGNGTCGNYETLPVQVTSLATGVVGVSAGAMHTCGLRSDATAWCWGANNQGQLGDGTFGGPLACGAALVKPSPVQVVMPCP